MILLALTTGMRVGDLIRLRWEDIELDSGRTHIKQGKGKKDRVIFIRPNFLSELVDMSKECDGLVFTMLQRKPVQDQYLRRMIGEKAKKAGISKRVHFHLLRHTYLTRPYGRRIFGSCRRWPDMRTSALRKSIGTFPAKMSGKRC